MVPGSATSTELRSLVTPEPEDGRLILMVYVRESSKYGLSVEKGTARVPDDGRYHFLVDGEIVLSTTVEALALAEMEEVKVARQAEGRELLRRERAALDVSAFRAGAWADKQSRDQKKGGRGIGR
jgi:hypothetical protein